MAQRVIVVVCLFTLFTLGLYGRAAADSQAGGLPALQAKVDRLGSAVTAITSRVLALEEQATRQVNNIYIAQNPGFVTLSFEPVPVAAVTVPRGNYVVHAIVRAGSLDENIIVCATVPRDVTIGSAESVTLAGFELHRFVLLADLLVSEETEISVACSALHERARTSGAMLSVLRSGDAP